MTTGQHLGRSHDISGKPRLRRLWPLADAPLLSDDPVPGSPLSVGLKIGREAQLLFSAGMRIR